jgi:hypothetical protein
MEFRIICRWVRTLKNKVLAWVLELTRGGITRYNADIIRRRADGVPRPGPVCLTGKMIRRRIQTRLASWRVPRFPLDTQRRTG